MEPEISDLRGGCGYERDCLQGTVMRLICGNICKLLVSQKLENQLPFCRFEPATMAAFNSNRQALDQLCPVQKNKLTTEDAEEKHLVSKSQS
jgi:hypothetical protein